MFRARRPRLPCHKRNVSASPIKLLGREQPRTSPASTQSERATMTRLKLATMLTLAVFVATMWGQGAKAQANAQEHEAHHPDVAKPAQAAPSPTPPAMG